MRVHLKPHFGQREVASITATTLCAGKPSSASLWSIKAQWTPLRMILSYAVRHGYATIKPADQLERRERPKAGRPRARFLTEPEMARLLDGSPARW